VQTSLPEAHTKSTLQKKERLLEHGQGIHGGINQGKHIPMNNFCLVGRRKEAKENNVNQLTK